ncbi:MAG TPA: transposase [Microbacterium sp.]|nr:transposase [Microbacterium sp.]
MANPTLEDVAAELYALPRDSFTRERDARAKAAGDTALADGIRSLRKPSLAAWIVDLLARRARDELGQAVELGAALREAQAELDAGALAELTTQRRALVAGLARRAAALAKEEGVTASQAALVEVEKTLNAAMRDAGAAAAVLTGRLVRTLDVVGFDAADLEGAVAGEIPAQTPRPTRDDLAERRARKAAERAAREAAQAAGAADRELTAAQAALTRAREHADRLRERIDQLRADLARIEAEAERADAAVAEADQARDAAARGAKKARRQAEAAAAEVAG